MVIPQTGTAGVLTPFKGVHAQTLPLEGVSRNPFVSHVVVPWNA